MVKEPSSVESSNSSMDTAQQPSHTTINSEASVQTSDNEENSRVSDFANSKIKRVTLNPIKKRIL